MWMLWSRCEVVDVSVGVDVMGGGGGSPFLISIADEMMDLFWSIHTQVGTVNVIILVSSDMWSH